MRLFIYDGVRYLLTSSTDEAISEFHRQLPQIKADIQGMRNSQSEEQKWFHRQDSWDIKEAFGTTTVEVFSKSGVVKVKRKIENPRQITTEFPVPVYELVSGDPYDPDLARFWVGLTNHWYNPTLNQEVNPVTKDRRGTEFEETTYGNQLVFPLKRIGEPIWITLPADPRYSWSTEDSSWGGDSPDTVWVGSGTGEWPWLVGDWRGTVSPTDYYEYDTGYIIKACDEDGEILRGNNLAHIEDNLVVGPGITYIQVGDTWGYNRTDYMYDFTITFGYITTWMTYFMPGSCPFVDYNVTTETGTEEHINYPVTGSKIESVYSQTTFSMEGVTIAGGSSDLDKDFTFTWVPASISGNVSISSRSDEPYLLDDAVVYGVDDWEDYSAWCAVFDVCIEDNTHNLNVTNSTDGNWWHDYGDAAYALDYPGVYKVFAKVANSNQEFVIFETPYTNSGEYGSYCYNCEIYDFRGKPVYIITTAIYKYNEDKEYIIYAMIYNNEIFLSEEFETVEMNNETAEIYESLTNWGLMGYFWARAVGVRQIDTVTDIIEIEE